jgi:ATPase subunit of ABC transporter with duplicated ATPase domains
MRKHAFSRRKVADFALLSGGWARRVALVALRLRENGHCISNT